jgi:UDP-N-acetylglucosamine 2-epimerase (non-hydrolysing)
MTFCGGWSYSQKEMDELFKHTWSNMNVLEFGAGDSTLKIFNLLKPSSYYVYETNPMYVPTTDDITTVLYDQDNIEKLEIDHGVVFDLILIDGPNGEKRKHWFSKLRSCVKPGTIVLIDDFNHYASFGEELDKHFDYELLSFSNEPFKPYGEHSWKIVRITTQYMFGIVDNSPRHGSYVIPSTINKKVCVDMGSNIGTFTMENHAKFDQIYCFEACYENYMKCRENTKNFQNVKVFHLAGFDKSRERMYIKKHVSNDHGSCSIISHPDWTDTKHPVETISIEDIIQMVGGKIDYMKVDIEGGEYDLLMNKDLSAIDCISIELHAQLGEKRDTLMTYLDSYYTKVNEVIWDHYEITYLKNQHTTTAVVYGTRPEFLKLKPLIDRINPVVIRINQHENFTEDQGYPHHIVHINKGYHRLTDIGSSILEQLPNYINNCTHVIAQGDTSSCFYSILCAYQMKKVCIHLEAGMRTYDNENPWPEESYRQMISRITSIHLCPSIREAHNLGAENAPGKYYIVGNTILDLVKSYDIPIIHEKHVLVTLHRRENWDQYKSIIQRLDTLAQQHPDYDFVFLLHANPELKSIVQEHGKNLKITEPLSHRELIKVLSSCTCVITDSGGIQEEANFLGKHIYVLRERTERTSIHPSRCEINPIDIKIDAPYHTQGFEYGDGNAVEKIVEILHNLCLL